MFSFDDLHSRLFFRTLLLLVVMQRKKKTKGCRKGLAHKAKLLDYKLPVVSLASDFQDMLLPPAGVSGRLQQISPTR